MADSRWNTSSPARGRRRGIPLWITLPLALAAGIAILVFALVGRATGMRRQAWPLIQAVHKRLSTDDGARELFRMNPACASGYASEEAFLEAVRTWRPKIGALPASEPAGQRDEYRVGSDPFEVTIAIKGSGGGWLRARFVTGPAAAGQNVGEGLTQLVFADSPKEILQSVRHARLQARAAQWTEFRLLLGRLATDESAQALYRAEPMLQRGWGSEAAFLQDARAWRPFLSELPEQLPDPEGPDDGRRVSFSNNQTPFGSSREIRYETPTSGWKAVWRDGALASLQRWKR